MNKVLLVIDMKKDFIDKNGILYIGETAKEVTLNIADRIAEYRLTNQPIIFIGDEHEQDDPEFKRFLSHCIRGSWGAEFVDMVAPKKGEVIISKKGHSGFFNTRLDLILAGLKDSVVEACGVCTSICVLLTVADLVIRDYVTVVRKNCVADFDYEAHNFALKYMKNILGAEVI